ncbi:MAG: phosphoenolpyruvate carboxykinase (ATP) [Vampirovibrio sp.]|nr:phosphoenolpyruvate carboxykinase (ATP) [Vampirovibrio sp.]
MTDYTGYAGIETAKPQHYQLDVDTLIQMALDRQEGELSDRKALVVQTGKYTGRSPKDRFIVDTPSVHDHIGWGKVNVPTSPDVFDRVFAKMKKYLADKELFIFDGYGGADPDYALKVRFINERASQSLFVHQLFVRPTADQLNTFEPEFTVICAPGLELDPAEDGVNSEAGVILNLEKKIILVAATQYSGEMKKGIFSVMNYLMPDRNVFPMHCSSNIGKDGKSALFFGLSGTGKTTLSADPQRKLVGDDEHGWSDKGIFNFEGGCYAKAIKLSRENEPEIWDAIRYGALAENIVLKENGVPDFDDDSLTENTRVGYPIESIPNAELSGKAPHPSTIIFLTADAFGVVPPISKLTSEQAQYHFISGYTSKVAGTERGITEPTAAFSTCFGEPFMPRPSSVYADLLDKRIHEHKVNVYLINTGWQGGPYGVGKRISIPHTRAMVTAALNGDLESVDYDTHPVLNIQVPTTCPGVPSEMLNPRNSWSDKAAYDTAVVKLAQMFVNNFKNFHGVDHLVAAGPKVPVEPPAQGVIGKV